MIEIRIPEVYYPEDPKKSSILRSKTEIFIEGFKKLCEATGMNSVITDKLLNVTIVTQLKFDDGALIGLKRLFQEIGFNVK